MSIRQLRAYLALALYALAVAVTVSAESLSRSAAMSGLYYDLTLDRITVVGAVAIASALFAWNVGEAVYRRYR
jgi:hypothetical protein